MPGRGCFGQLIGCVATIALVAVVFFAFDTYLIAPWAHGDGSRLTGTWVGEFRSPSGRHGFLEIELHHDTWSGGRGHRNWSRRGYGLLSGTALSCGLVDWPKYDLTGGANRSGSDVSIVIAVPQPAPAGMYWHELRGSWSGDSLRLSGVLAAYAGTTHTVDGGAIDENQTTHIALHPGTSVEYYRSCRAQGLSSSPR